MMRRFFSSKIWRTLLFCVAAWGVRAEDVKMEWMPSGAYDKLYYYAPQRLTLSPEKPEGIKNAPADLAAPLYGKLQFGPFESPTTFFVIVDEPEGKPARLFVDANANGDLTDDPPAEWKGQEVKSRDDKILTNYAGGADLRMAYGGDKVNLHLRFYRFDPHDPSRADYANYLFYYRDYSRVGEVTLGEKTYKAMLVDDAASGDFRPTQGSAKNMVKLFLDLNNNGKFEMRGESFDINQPFKVGDTNYEISGLDASGGTFQIAKTSKTVPEPEERTQTPRAPRPAEAHLPVGSKALAFEAKTIDGNAIHFPESYKGKLVLLDFWATWCGPCRGEIPHVAEAYEKFHSKGFEILGVSLDQANATEMLAKFTKDNQMAWPEVYDGKFWGATVAQIYSIHSIPQAFLVDGDTGEIVAEGEAIRGGGLARAIEKALAKHQ